MIRTVLVDDEEPARDRLRALLSEIGTVRVVGVAGDAEEALQQISQSRPNLVFLDIQMPGCSGMDVAASMPSPRPKIEFFTAFEEYAVDAFELHAVDYLLKPISRVRLAKAVQRARDLPVTSEEGSLEKASHAVGGYPARFLAKHGSRYQVVPADAVLLFTSEGGLTQLRTAEQRYWKQPSLTELDTRLDPARFFRVSRSDIVNLDAVREVKPVPGGEALERPARGGQPPPAQDPHGPAWGVLDYRLALAAHLDSSARSPSPDVR